MIGEKLKKSNQERIIYCEGKLRVNDSVLINLRQDFRMVIPSVERTVIDV